ncbi:MAG: hypothetical protein QFX32_08090 [Methanolinea sp.]|nr:hypothetical protein [Methanolinea sp.]
MTEEKREDNEHTGPREEPGGEEQLYDLLIPPGVPRSIIAEIIRKFDVQLVERKQRLYFANMDGDERELLAFRGKKKTMEEVQDYLYYELKKFIGE